MTDYTYEPKITKVQAIQWKVDNFPDIVAFLKKHVGEGEVAGIRNERFSSLGTTYNMVQFYAWGDDVEVDPGQWIVVYPENTDLFGGEIMSDAEFTRKYKKVNK